MRVERLFSILIYIMHHKRVSATKLAEHFDVTSRTIYRDLELLEQSGVPLVSYTGREGGYEILDTFSLTKFTFTDEEKKILLAGLTLQQSHIESKKIKQLIQKLDLLLNHKDASDLPFVYKQSLQQHELLQQEIRRTNQVIERAIHEKKVLEFEYINQTGDQSSRRVFPHFLQYSYASWYLVGYCLKRQALRQFKITRMLSLKVLELSVPEDFVFPKNKEESDMPQVGMEQQNVLLQFSNKQLGFVLDYVPKEWIEHLGDTSFTICIPDVNLQAFLYHPLLYFDSSKILEPVTLKKQFRKLLEKKLNTDT